MPRLGFQVLGDDAKFLWVNGQGGDALAMVVRGGDAARVSVAMPGPRPGTGTC